MAEEEPSDVDMFLYVYNWNDHQPYTNCVGPHRTQIRGNRLWAALCHDYRTNYDKAFSPKTFLQGTLQTLKFKYSRGRQEVFRGKLKYFDKHGGTNGGREALLALDLDYKNPTLSKPEAESLPSSLVRLEWSPPSPASPIPGSPSLGRTITPPPCILQVHSSPPSSQLCLFPDVTDESVIFSPRHHEFESDEPFSFNSPSLSDGPNALNSPAGDSTKEIILCLGLGVPLLPAANLLKTREKLLREANNAGNKELAEHLQRSMQEEDPHMDALHCVYYKVDGLPVIAARDYIRGHLTQTVSDAVVFGVSMDCGAHSTHPYKHVEANFNRTHSFFRHLQLAIEMGRSETLLPSHSKIRFSQVILDYFWIPDGTWQMEHWQPQFFSGTLPGLAEKDLLVGRVYLPFTMHCFTQVLVAKEKLLCYYNIRFLRKESLSEIALWAGTQSIDPVVCQEVLGKHRQQEETECSFDMETINVALRGYHQREGVMVCSSYGRFWQR
jgi:hypothetical protein